MQRETADAGGGGSRDESRRSYALGAVVRITGLSEHTLRAWERRYEAVRPQRTPGGSRRYTEADVRRLRLLRQVVDAGQPIGEVARLPDADIERLAAAFQPQPPPLLRELLEAAETLDAAELERQLGLQLAALGPSGFAREVAVPLLAEVGRRWECGELPTAAEHIVSAALRTLLGLALRSERAAPDAPVLLFTTPSGEQHELGALAAALLARNAGGRSVYLGPELPVEELAAAAKRLEADVVVIALAALPADRADRYLSALRRALAAPVGLWVGGGESTPVTPVPGATRLKSFDDLEEHVERLLERAVRRPA